MVVFFIIRMCLYKELVKVNSGGISIFILKSRCYPLCRVNSPVWNGSRCFCRKPFSDFDLKKTTTYKTKIKKKI